MTDAPKLLPCPFCGGEKTTIEGKGQLWRGTKGYSDPQYFQLTHHGELSPDDKFPRCFVEFRTRTEYDAVIFWNTRHCTANSDGLTNLEQHDNDEARHAHREMAMVALKVKPLEWRKSEISGWNDDWHTVPTGYAIRCADENGWKWSCALGVVGYEHSASAAKAAAQADYEARILAALE